MKIKSINYCHTYVLLLLLALAISIVLYVLVYEFYDTRGCMTTGRWKRAALARDEETRQKNTLART